MIQAIKKEKRAYCFFVEFFGFEIQAKLFSQEAFRRIVLKIYVFYGITGIIFTLMPNDTLLIISDGDAKVANPPHHPLQMRSLCFAALDVQARLLSISHMKIETVSKAVPSKRCGTGTEGCITLIAACM